MSWPTGRGALREPRACRKTPERSRNDKLFEKVKSLAGGVVPTPTVRAMRRQDRADAAISLSRP